MIRHGEFCVLFILCRIDIWNATQHITENVAFFLPKNANIDQVFTILCMCILVNKSDELYFNCIFINRQQCCSFVYIYYVISLNGFNFVHSIFRLLYLLDREAEWKWNRIFSTEKLKQ